MTGRPTGAGKDHDADASPTPTSFAEHVKAQLTAQGLSYRRLAAETRRVDPEGVGLSSGHLANLVAERQRPSARAAELLSRALNVQLIDSPEARRARSTAVMRRALRSVGGDRCDGCGLDAEALYPALKLDRFFASVIAGPGGDELRLCPNCQLAASRGVELPMARDTQEPGGRRRDDAFRGDVVSRYRRSGLSQRDVAAEFGISPATVARWLREATGGP